MEAPEKKSYGWKELAYAEPFANALADDPSFRAWVLRRTKFAHLADGSCLLSKEMKAQRSSSSVSWWRSHYTDEHGETDILAIFESATGVRFALHFEVKQPGDKFPAKKNQPMDYAIRAKSWVSSPPKAVLPHSDASTVLLCSEQKLNEYAPHPSGFDAVLTFEEIARTFPSATLPSRSGTPT